MIRITRKDVCGYKGDLLVFFVAESGKKKAPSLYGQHVESFTRAWQNGDFSGSSGQTFLCYPPGTDKDFAAQRVLVVGLGGTRENENEQMELCRLAAGTAATTAAALNIRQLQAVLPAGTGLKDAAVAESIAEGLILGSYRFDRYKTKEETKKSADCKTVLHRITLHSGGLDSRKVRKGMKQGLVAAQAACSARDMANEPGNGWTPEQFADYAKDIASKSCLRCQIIDKARMKKLGMGGILGVNQGSALPPKLVVLKYVIHKKWPTVLLVGKGLTFDSGGISLKPAAGMEDMKYDMCGGAAVLCAMQVIAAEKPKGVNVIALVPATENLSGAAAIKPGDIITHFGGKTSEVINTDAEGRLILADALAYGIATFKPDAVVDLATLTGAVIVGLGHHRTGLMATDDNLAEKLLSAGDRAAEPLWRLPLGPEYSKQIESKVADIRNIGGKGAGSITAAAYLQEFTGDTPWAHLDIAGTAWNFTEKSYVPKGPSGIAVRTLVNFIRNWKK